MTESPPSPAFLVYVDGNGRRRVHAIDSDTSPVTVGRETSAAISLFWDEKVSRMHARLELVGEDPATDWTLVDDGSSRNGSFVNGQRVRGRTRLSDGDTLSFGDTAVVFRAPGGESAADDTAEQPAAPAERSETIMMSIAVSRASLSDSEHRVLSALAKPCRPPASGPPATNEQIARDLFLGTATVERHLLALFQRFGIGSLEPDEQRKRLVERALALGVLHD